MPLDEMPDLSASIGRLLEDPEMLGKALSVATALKNSGMLDGLINAEKSPAPPPAPEKEKEETYSPPPKAYTEKELPKAPALPSPRQEQNGWDANSAHRRALLLALRPYMSRERQERIDTVLRILELLDLASKLGNGKPQ